MKLSFYISLIVLIGISTVQAASAQEARGARFNYAPNVWKAESARIPKGYGDYVEPQHNVRAGAVPQNDILGVDPMMLSKPAPASPVVTTATTPKLMAPQTNANFNPAFGRPIMAQLPSVIPQHASALPMIPQARPAAATPAQAAKPTVRPVTALVGRVKPVYPQHVKPASAPAAIASYPNGMGYSGGGPQLAHPRSSGVSNASTSLTGVILSNTKHSH